MKYEKSCGAIVYRMVGENREFLLLRHKNGGHWSFPKGHVEKNETEEETATREIREETGLCVNLCTDIRLVTSFSPNPGVEKEVVYFAAIAEDMPLKGQEEEVLALRWLPFAQALALLTYENDKKLLSQVTTYLKSGTK